MRANLQILSAGLYRGNGERNPHQEMPSLQKPGNGLLSDIGESCSEMFFPFNNSVWERLRNKQKKENLFDACFFHALGLGLCKDEP